MRQPLTLHHIKELLIPILFFYISRQSEWMREDQKFMRKLESCQN